MNFSILIPRRKRKAPHQSLLTRCENALLRKYDFLLNIRFYWLDQRLPFRKSVELAKVTLPS